MWDETQIIRNNVLRICFKPGAAGIYCCGMFCCGQNHVFQYGSCCGCEQHWEAGPRKPIISKQSSNRTHTSKLGTDHTGWSLRMPHLHSRYGLTGALASQCCPPSRHVSYRLGRDTRYNADFLRTLQLTGENCILSCLGDDFTW